MTAMVCLQCLYRWWASLTTGDFSRKLQCPQCNRQEATRARLDSRA